MIIVACPGQGSQTPGFLQPWLDNPEARQRLETVSELIGVDLVKHGTESDAETIRATNIAQPLIVAAGMLTLDAIQAELGKLPADQAVSLKEKFIFAGHSVGEVTAAYGAGVFDAETALRFVAARATEMQKCAEAKETSMVAVLGGDQDSVVAHLEGLNLVAANYNGAGQIVAAGDVSAVTELLANPPARARVIPLKVAGAFHTAAMAPAREALAAVAAKFRVSDPSNRILTNFDGSTVRGGQEYLDLLVNQVANPVRWDLCMAAAADAGAEIVAEVAPSGTLVGLAKRAMRGTVQQRLDTPAAVTDFVRNLAETTGESD